MTAKKIKSLMTAHPRMISPTQTVDEAAKQMKAADCGCLPVGTGDHVVGVLTDRDIALRVTAEDRDAKATLVQDVMTKGAFSIDEDRHADDAALEMQVHNIGRLIVTKSRKVTGILSMAALLRDAASKSESSRLLKDLARFRHAAAPS